MVSAHGPWKLKLLYLFLHLNVWYTIRVLKMRAFHYGVEVD